VRYRFLPVVLLFSLSACSFQVEVVTPPPSLTVPPVTSPALASPTDTASPLPTSTFTPDITPPPLQESAHPIRFAPNGTYANVIDSLLAGTSKTYSINALKGQIMSISIHQSLEGDWTSVPMKIVGADGVTLCPPTANADCAFWRGALPSSQDYFVTITPAADILNFTMRVAINPPGVSTQSFQYRSESQNAAFSYPDDFAPARFSGPLVYKVEPGIALEFIDTQFYTDTNLIEAYLLFGSTDENSLVESCTQPVSYGGPESVVGEVNINGIKFVRSEGAGLGAGNVYEQVYHRVASQGFCHEVTFFIHYANIGNYSPESGVREFDQDALLQRFEDVLSTLVIK